MNEGFLGFFKNAKKDENHTETGTEGKTLSVKTARCPQNHACPAVRVCPVNALSQEGIKAPKVDMDQCVKCGKCVKFCPMRALVLE